MCYSELATPAKGEKEAELVESWIETSIADWLAYFGDKFCVCIYLLVSADLRGQHCERISCKNKKLNCMSISIRFDTNSLMLSILCIHPHNATNSVCLLALVGADFGWRRKQLLSLSPASVNQLARRYARAGTRLNWQLIEH